jgi:hypothetical protein
LLPEDRQSIDPAHPAIPVAFPKVVTDLMMHQAVTFIMPQQTIASENMQAVQLG